MTHPEVQSLDLPLIGREIDLVTNPLASDPEQVTLIGEEEVAEYTNPETGVAVIPGPKGAMLYRGLKEAARRISSGEEPVDEATQQAVGQLSRLIMRGATLLADQAA